MNLFDANLAKANEFFAKKDYGKALILSLASEVINEEVAETGGGPEKTLVLENFKGHCFLGMEDLTSAQNSFQTVITQRPQTPEAHFGLAMTLWNMGLKEKALSHFQEGFDLDAFNRLGVMYYAKALHSMGKETESQKLILNHFKENPNDLEVLDLLLELSNVEAEKRENSELNLTIVTGLHGSGKTTYSGKLGFPVIHIDNFFNYQTNQLNFKALQSIKDFHAYYLNKNLKSIVLDAYILHVDPDLQKLKEVIDPVENICVKFVYASQEEIYNSQRSTTERKANMDKEPLPKEESIRWNQKTQITLFNKFNRLLETNVISGIDFIYREGNDYSVKSKEHFLKTVGEVDDWRMNRYELMALVNETETQQYQTIEFEGEIIRPGTEQCWLSWENILKFGIDWKGKYVCDLGSYFGYFSLQVLKAGAKKTLGIDQSESLLNVYSELLKANRFNNFETKSILLGNGNNVPDESFDVIMALNMLHHIQKNTSSDYYLEVLDSIFRNAKEIVFEINDYQIDEISCRAEKFNFACQKKITSHRNTMYGQRYLFYYKKISS